MSVYFHANFNLDRDRMSGVLKYLIEEPTLSDLEIAQKFGYKTPFTKRYKSWLRKCGIIEVSRKIILTEHGQEIYKNDPKLEGIETLKFMHSCLTQSNEHAESWFFFYHEFLPKNESFSKEELSKAISMKLMPHDPKHFGMEAPMIKVITKVLIDSYLSEKAFEPLKLISSKNDTFYKV